MVDPVKPRLLDLYCCQGGASAGYVAAGFEVVGVDLFPQPRYPYEFHQADALDYLAKHGSEFDAIAGSPPCQDYSETQRIRGNVHPRLIAPTRKLMRQVGKPYIIENVVGSDLIDPILLCGSMFGLRTYRHRLFESNIALTPPHHPAHVAHQAKMGRPPLDGEFIHVVGNFSGVELARTEAIRAPWMNREGLRECIPPAYTEHLGRQLLDSLATSS